MERRSVALFTVALALSTALGTLPAAKAGGSQIPSIRLFAASSSITAQRSGKYVYVDPGAWIESVNGAFQLNVSRPDYDTPVGISQVDPTTGDVLRTLPATVLDGWYGLSDFSHLSIRDHSGKLITRFGQTWCPDTWSPQRVSDAGPAISRYPTACFANPFTKSMVWGIDDGWAVSAVGGYCYYYCGLRLAIPDGHYSLRVWIGSGYGELLGIPPADASVTIDLTVETVKGAGSADRQKASAPASTEDPVPTVTTPDPATEPDLQALPAWGIGVFHRQKHDYLAFGATAWNDGPSGLVVEGFRRSDSAVMDAYQYFYDANGTAVGRAPVGTLEYDSRPGHNHWHFQQFAAYSILDGSGSAIAPSTK